MRRKSPRVNADSNLMKTMIYFQENVKHVRSSPLDLGLLSIKNSLRYTLKNNFNHIPSLAYVLLGIAI